MVDLGRVYWIAVAYCVNLDVKALRDACIKFEHSLTDKTANNLMSDDVKAFWVKWNATFRVANSANQCIEGNSCFADSTRLC